MAAKADRLCLSKSPNGSLLDVLQVMLSSGSHYCSNLLAPQQRRTCRAFRDLHDRFACKMAFYPSNKMASLYLMDKSWQYPSPAAIDAVITGLVTRLFRPTDISLCLPYSPDKSIIEDRAVTFLKALAKAASVSKVFLSWHAIATPPIAIALANVSPTLRSLSISLLNTHSAVKDLPEAPALDAAGLEEVLANFRLLLQLTGPRLTELIIWPDRKYWPTQALAAISHCTVLTKLEVYPDWLEGGGDANLEAELSFLRGLGTLSSLQELLLRGGAVPSSDLIQRALRASPALSCLSTLTALTRLELDLRCVSHYHCARWPTVVSLESQEEQLLEADRSQDVPLLYAAAAAEWRGLVAAVRCMPVLRVLWTPIHAAVEDLAGLVSLRELRVGTIVLPGVESTTALYNLPPQLTRLDTIRPQSPRVLASLNPPPLSPSGEPTCVLLLGGRLCNVHETPWCLLLSDADILNGRLTSAAAADLRAAVCSLQYYDFRPSERQTYGMDEVPRGLRISAPHGEMVASPIPLNGGDSSHVASWLGSVTAPRPVLLRLTRFTLSPMDMHNLACSLNGLEILDLDRCEYSVSSLPLLASLTSLQELRVDYHDWGLDAFDESIEASLMCLVTAAGAAATGGAEGLAEPVHKRTSKLELVVLYYSMEEGAEPFLRAVARAQQMVRMEAGEPELKLELEYCGHIHDE